MWRSSHLGGTEHSYTCVWRRTQVWVVQSYVHIDSWIPSTRLCCGWWMNTGFFFCKDKHFANVWIASLAHGGTGWEGKFRIEATSYTSREFISSQQWNSLWQADSHLNAWIEAISIYPLILTITPPLFSLLWLRQHFLFPLPATACFLPLWFTSFWILTSI